MPEQFATWSTLLLPFSGWQQNCADNDRIYEKQMMLMNVFELFDNLPFSSKILFRINDTVCENRPKFKSPLILAHTFY